MANLKFNDILREIEKRLPRERYYHSVGVAMTAGNLAAVTGESFDDAILSGLLHDLGKAFPEEEQVRLCGRYGISLSESEMKNHALVHAKLGAFFAEKEFGIHDEKILSAILFHTTGRPMMSAFEKILYVADYIEPNRKEIPGLTDVRKIAFSDLDLAVTEITNAVVTYLRKTGKPIDTITEETYRYYKNEIEKRG